MRGKDEQQLDVFSYVSPEQRVPQDHPLRPLRIMTDEALRELQPRFHKLYAKTGRPSIAPEKLLRALLQAWARGKSYQRKDARNAVPPDDPGNATVDFHGEKRSNQTHASKTDPDAKMARKGKGKEAKLSYNGNLLVENRNGLIVNTEVFEANGTAERDAALVMLEQIPGTKHVTVGGDKG